MAAGRTGSFEKPQFTHQMHTFSESRVTDGLLHIMMEFILIACGVLIDRDMSYLEAMQNIDMLIVSDHAG